MAISQRKWCSQPAFPSFSDKPTGWGWRKILSGPSIMVLLRSWKYRNWSGSDSHICIPSPFQIVSLSKSYLWNQRVGISTNRSRMKSRELCIIMYLNTLSIEQNHIRKKYENTTQQRARMLPCQRRTFWLNADEYRWLAGPCNPWGIEMHSELPCRLVRKWSCIPGTSNDAYQFCILSVIFIRVPGCPALHTVSKLNSATSINIHDREKSIIFYARSGSTSHGAAVTILLRR